MSKESKREAVRISVRGVVQGVGFRPFVYQLAVKHALNGFVFNTSEDVIIEIEGNRTAIDRFTADLADEKPPRAVIENISMESIAPSGAQHFEIRDSVPRDGRYQLISPDIATCPDCLADIADPKNRRYRYPFTNCTNCGPRFTIIEDIPYDRPLTTMKAFTMCPECSQEYNDPLNRRFHAQPNACPVCGPELTLLDATGNPVAAEDPIGTTAKLIKDGQIIAIKGLGGYLLACNAGSEATVQRLRERKHRPSKPFAVMVTSVDQARKLCDLSDREEELLLAPGAPIVLLKWNNGDGICETVAPNNRYLGVMLPYTPLHHLLLSETGFPLIMTSGNLSEEPICKDNDEALRRLSGIADFFLTHNRDIFARYDDSVMMVSQSSPRMVRRARGYAPYPVKLPQNIGQVLACGAELKNTFCLTRDNYAFVSQHIGDMENLETLDHFENTVSLYRKLFRIEPEILAYDLHPDYLPTKYARERIENDPALKPVAVQHHHAHIASCMADNDISGPVIGIAFDGTGYGTDGHIWGGEFLVADYNGFDRVARFEYLPLPGGEAAIRKPYRIAAGYLYALFGNSVFKDSLPFCSKISSEELGIIISQVDRSINTPITSSCGRLFDAVSALLGFRTEVDFEAQAAIDLEMSAFDSDDTDSYRFSIEDTEGPLVIRFRDMFEDILVDLHKGTEKATIASRFHNTVARITGTVCTSIAGKTGISSIALSGGVFQNRLLLHKTIQHLESAGFSVYTHRQVPTNDGGISLGQAVVAGYSRR